MPTFLPSHLLALPPSYFLIFKNICVYPCSSVVSPILFPLSYYVKQERLT